MMYGALWRRLPGPVPLRVGLCLVLLALVVAVCFAWVFPWIAAHLPVNDPSVGTLGGPGTPRAPAIPEPAPASGSMPW